MGDIDEVPGNSQAPGEEAERERCAKIAHQQAEIQSPALTDYENGYRDAAIRIAELISGGHQPFLEAIENARKDETKRCVKIAESSVVPEIDDWDRGFNAACGVIVRGIRKKR